MKLLFKQRAFSWLDNYDIYDEDGNTVYVVKGAVAWGHLLRIYDAKGNKLGHIQEQIFKMLPKFEMYIGDNLIGTINREFTLFTPRYNIECKGWQVEGDWFGWDYMILDVHGELVATITKEIFNFTDTYSIDVKRSSDALCALMLVLAIDAEKCSRRDW